MDSLGIFRPKIYDKNRLLICDPIKRQALYQNIFYFRKNTERVKICSSLFNVDVVTIFNSFLSLSYIEETDK